METLSRPLFRRKPVLRPAGARRDGPDERNEKRMSEVVYITGHKNPDTDSICAAIAYAELKRRLGVPAVAARAGKLNRETEFVLDYFGVEAPQLLDSVRTQVSDLDIDGISPVSADISIRTAWNVMQKNNRKMLPVADEKGRLLGIVTLSDITESYMNTLETNSLSVSGTPLRNIAETIRARLVTGDEKAFRFTGKVVIATMSIEHMSPFLEKGDIVLTGDSGDVQRKAIESGACCIVLTCGGKAAPGIAAFAREKGCLILETAYDTYTAARLVNQSIPVGCIMTRRGIISFSPDDYIDNIRDRMLKTRFRSYPVVDSGGAILGFLSRYHLISHKHKKVILLDHNERSQTVDGIEEAEILEIIDHHRLGGIETGYPVFFRNEIVGSTSTMIGSMFFENGIIPPRKTAGILCAAILSDTIRLRSPTSTYTDAAMAAKLANIAEIDIDGFADRMFRAGSSLEGMSPAEILSSDFKDYMIGKYKVGIGQINSYDPRSLDSLKPGLLEYMRSFRKANGYGLLLLMITDIVNEGSAILFDGDGDKLIQSAFHPAAGEDSVFLKGVVSRKKQVVPLITCAVEAL